LHLVGLLFNLDGQKFIYDTGWILNRLPVARENKGHISTCCYFVSEGTK